MDYCLSVLEWLMWQLRHSWIGHPIGHHHICPGGVKAVIGGGSILVAQVYRVLVVIFQTGLSQQVVLH